MAVRLLTSAQAHSGTPHDQWCAIHPAQPDLPGETMRKGLGAELERALDEVFPAWLQLGCALAVEPGGRLVHAATGAHNASDLGLMMAWRNKVTAWVQEAATIVVVCDDPWMYRALAEIDGVISGRAPSLAAARAVLTLRGLAARSRAAVRVIRAWAALRWSAKTIPAQHASLLVYGHPQSDAQGMDAYFGDLMRWRLDLLRMLHTDCGLARARALMADGRTFSLHGFGRLTAALAMPFVTWRPNDRDWLIRRAAARENSTPGPAMTHWQTICQRRWLETAKPQVVAWPWENHPWERDFSLAAGTAGVRTVGYQHASFGRQERNHAITSNTDGTLSLPDLIVCTGEVWRARLAAFGLPEDRLRVGGAWRCFGGGALCFDEAGPVFVALARHRAVAREMVRALEPLAASGWRFVVKPHPMTSIAIDKRDGIAVTDRPMHKHGGLCAVIFASSTVGLEARLAGLPVVRFLPTALVESDVMPETWNTQATTADNLEVALLSLRPEPAPNLAQAFAPVDIPAWKTWMRLQEPLPSTGPPLASGPLAAIRRKATQILKDPVLRHWLIGKMIGRHGGEPKFVPHQPPYLAQLETGETPAAARFPSGPRSEPTAPTCISLPGRNLRLDPGDEGWLFGATLGDSETWLGLHRFAWVPLAGGRLDPAWLHVLYREWKSRFADQPGGWPWHPYTAAERAVNLIDFAALHGPPEAMEAFTALLRIHAEEIERRLEYYGDHHTGNHLANNGRGLYRIGLALGDARIAAVGRTILHAEAKRILTPTGTLREGSSHYQLIVTRWYVDCWLAARRHLPKDAPDLETIAGQMLAALPGLALPGGFPLIGDISPDSPPEFLFADNQFGGAWLSVLPADEREAVEQLRNESGSGPHDESWHRFVAGEWTGLWHVTSEGWPFMPGHGHNDCGGFELHWRDVPVFVDPGRGTYGENGDAVRYRSADMHNTLTIDSRDPYPPNRPYYDKTYRESVCSGATIIRSDDGLEVRHGGYQRFRHVGAVQRDWRFSDDGLALRDRVAGQGRHLVRRRFITPHPVTLKEENAVIDAGRVLVTLSGAKFSVSPVIRWRAYGRGEPAWAVDAACEADLPMDHTIWIEARSACP